MTEANIESVKGRREEITEAEGCYSARITHYMRCSYFNY
jgi:hypothetical protein